MQETKALISRWRGNLGVVLERRPQCAVSHEVRRRGHNARYRAWHRANCWYIKSLGKYVCVSTCICRWKNTRPRLRRFGPTLSSLLKKASGKYFLPFSFTQCFSAFDYFSFHVASRSICQKGDWEDIDQMIHSFSYARKLALHNKDLFPYWLSIV